MTDATNKLVTTERKIRGPFVDFWIRLVKEKPIGVAGALIVFIALFTAIFANLISPYDPVKSDLIARLAPPSATHILGTDNLGRDLLSRIIYGARVSVYIGLAASALNVIISSFIGLISGYFGGWFDLIVQRFVDVALSLPFLVVLIVLVGVIGTGWLQITLVMGIFGGILWTRIVRGAVLSMKQNVYVDSARSIGGTVRHIIMRHILPNILPIMIIIFSVSIAGNIMAEASLSFLGLGVPPPNPTWGGMLSSGGTLYMEQAWWLAIFPGLALTIVVWSVNMWGDAVRDILDPRLRGGVGHYGTAVKRQKAKIKLQDNNA